MEYKNQTENRAFQEMLQAAVNGCKIVLERILLKKAGLFFIAVEICLRYRVFMK